MTRAPLTRPPRTRICACSLSGSCSLSCSSWRVGSGGPTPGAHPDSIRHVTPHPNDSFISFRWLPAVSFYLIISALVFFEEARVSASCFPNVLGRDNNNNHNNEICLFESVKVYYGTNPLVLFAIGRDWTTSRTERFISLPLQLFVQVYSQ